MRSFIVSSFSLRDVSASDWGWEGGGEVELARSAEGGIRKTEREREGVVTSSSNCVSESLCWKELFRSMHCEPKKRFVCSVFKGSGAKQGKRTYAFNVIPETLYAITTEDEPHFEGAETPTKGKVPVAVINHQT